MSSEAEATAFRLKHSESQGWRWYGLTFLLYWQVPLLEAGDIIIDGGNSEYRDSIVSNNL